MNYDWIVFFTVKRRRNQRQTAANHWDANTDEDLYTDTFASNAYCVVKIIWWFVKKQHCAKQWKRDVEVSRLEKSDDSGRWSLVVLVCIWSKEERETDKNIKDLYISTKKKITIQKLYLHLKAVKVNWTHERCHHSKSDMIINHFHNMWFKKKIWQETSPSSKPPWSSGVIRWWSDDVICCI